jgi:hypothetical protein
VNLSWCQTEKSQSDRWEVHEVKCFLLVLREAFAVVAAGTREAVNKSLPLALHLTWVPIIWLTWPLWSLYFSENKISWLSFLKRNEPNQLVSLKMVAGEFPKRSMTRELINEMQPHSYNWPQDCNWHHHLPLVPILDFNHLWPALCLWSRPLPISMTKIYSTRGSEVLIALLLGCDCWNYSFQWIEWIKTHM